MTPQEQIEELKKAVNKLADLSVYLCEEVYDEPDGEKITDAVARFENGRDLVLRAIRFDPPQISDEMVEAGAVAMMGLSYQRWDSLYEMAKNISRIKASACLSAALTQKGDSNE